MTPAERRRAKCSECGKPAAYYCVQCKQPVCEQEAEMCGLFLHNWREMDEKSTKS